jgi:hypothetical protein
MEEGVMGRIRKTLAWTFSPGGNMHGLVRPESSAEQAAGDLADLLREQNRLLAQIAGERSPEDNRAALEFEERAQRVAAGTIEQCDIDNSLLRARVRIIREGCGDL